MTKYAEVFAEIERTNDGVHGWCSTERACIYAAMVFAYRPKVCVVVGAWGGRDVFALARACRALGVGRVVAIDPWSARASVEGQDVPANVEWWGRQERHDAVYQSFMAKLAEFELADWVTVIRKPSDDVGPMSGIEFFLSDGNHGPQSIRDIEKFAPDMPLGAIVYADDLNWSGGSVMKSVQRLIDFGFREMFKQDTGAFFQRVK